MREGISSAENKHLARRFYVELVNQGKLVIELALSEHKLSEVSDGEV